MGAAMAEPVTWVTCAIFLVVIYSVTKDKRFPQNEN